MASIGYTSDEDEVLPEKSSRMIPSVIQDLTVEDDDNEVLLAGSIIFLVIYWSLSD